LTRAQLAQAKKFLQSKSADIAKSALRCGLPGII
jgi:hypothetical protein